jgi:hypothetical protein
MKDDTQSRFRHTHCTVEELYSSPAADQDGEEEEYSESDDDEYAAPKQDLHGSDNDCFQDAQPKRFATKSSETLDRIIKEEDCLARKPRIRKHPNPDSSDKEAVEFIREQQARVNPAVLDTDEEDTAIAVARDAHQKAQRKVQERENSIIANTIAEGLKTAQQTRELEALRQARSAQPSTTLSCFIYANEGERVLKCSKTVGAQ